MGLAIVTAPPHLGEMKYGVEWWDKSANNLVRLELDLDDVNSRVFATRLKPRDEHFATILPIQCETGSCLLGNKVAEQSCLSVLNPNLISDQCDGFETGW